MKIFKKITMVPVAVFVTLSFAACSSDVDDNYAGGDGSGMTGWIKVDGREINFTHGYTWDEDGEDVLDLYTVNMLYYYEHPDKFPSSGYYSTMQIEIEDKEYGNAITNYYLDALIDYPFDDEEYEENLPDSYAEYSSDYSSTTPIKAVKSDKSVSFSGVNIAMRKGYEYPYQQVTADFSAGGIPTDLSKYMYDDYGSRSINIVKITDRETINWFRSLHRKISE